ncbi:MAG: GpE family phage tail protein [Planctomycetota bacterium]
MAATFHVQPSEFDRMSLATLDEWLDDARRVHAAIKASQA